MANNNINYSSAIAILTILNFWSWLQMRLQWLYTRKVSAASGRAAFHPSALMYVHTPLEHTVVLKSVWGQITDLQFGEVLLKLLKAHPCIKINQQNYKRDRFPFMSIKWSNCLRLSGSLMVSWSCEGTNQNSPCSVGRSLSLSCSDVAIAAQSLDLQAGGGATPQGSRTRTRRINRSLPSLRLPCEWNMLLVYAKTVYAMSCIRMWQIQKLKYMTNPHAQLQWLNTHGLSRVQKQF